MANPKPPKPSYFGYNKREPIKIATSNLFLDTGKVPVDYMVGAIFNEIGGQELINYGSSEFLKDPKILPISDISNVLDKYSSYNILNNSDGTATIFGVFDINLNKYIPEPSLLNITTYIDDTWKNIIIELEDGAEDYYIEVEFVSGSIA
jgi:hypothetical protein